MSKTYRIIDYKYGRPVYTRNIRQVIPYRFYRHECKEVRKWLWRSYRHRAKMSLKKYGYVPKWINTCGWETW